LSIIGGWTRRGGEEKRPTISRRAGIENPHLSVEEAMAMSEQDKAAIAKLGLWQGVIVAIIAGVFGVIASYLQFAVQQPATADEIVETFDRRLPVGTIVSSVVAPKLFSELAGDPGGFGTSESIWVPADDRDVSGSIYAKETGRTKVPDLRGMFLRGLNYSSPDRLRSDDWIDPDDPKGKERTAGDVQRDSFGMHRHETSSISTRGWESNASGQIWIRHGEKGGKVGEAGQKETRPKNVAVYYYIKIN
jgi:hypothetical protein